MRVEWSKQGGSVSLECGLPQPADMKYTLEWRKDGHLIFSAFGEQKGHPSPEMLGRVAKSSSLGLTVHSVESVDQGVYQCIITAFTKGPVSSEHGPPITLVVNAPPMISSPVDGTIEYLPPSSSFDVSCMADGIPPPEVTWTKSESLISNNVSLHINRFQSNDQGEYICNAANSAGEVRSRLILHFEQPTKIDFAPQNRTVTEGSSLFWHCHATAFPDRIMYTWKRNGRPIKMTEVGLRSEVQGGDLSIRSVQRGDSGWYTCEADNARGEPTTASAFLLVNYAPVVLATNRRLYTIGIGGRIQIECTSDAQPAVERVVWTKDGKYISTTTQTHMVIPSASDADSGVYVCQASNSVGESDAFEIHLIVAEPPRFMSRPPPNVHAKEGSNVEVECSGFGDPVPIQYWVRDKHRITSSKLSLSSVSHSDHGLYTCVITNSAATIKTNMKLFVQNSRPQPAEITTVNCVGENGLSVEWTPGYDGGAPQSYSLYFTNVDDPTESGRIGALEARTQLKDLSKFSRFRLIVESKNEKGSTNSSQMEEKVCSHLSSPSELSLNEEELHWDKMDGAMSYRVEYRYTYASDKQYSELAEVVGPPFRLPKEPGTSDMEIRVRSLRPHYSDGPPSEALVFNATSDSARPSPVLWAFFGGAVFIVIFLIIYLIARRKTNKKKNKKKKTFKSNGKPRAVCELNGFVDKGYECASSNVLEDRLDSGHWTESRNECLNAIQPYSYEELEAERGSVVDDMFRHKYMYATEGGHTESARANILDHLRIERLRREFKQSQL